MICKSNVESSRDEITYLVLMEGKTYNLSDGSLSEAPSPMGYYSAEAFLNDLEAVLKKNKVVHHMGYAIVLKAVE